MNNCHILYKSLGDLESQDFSSIGQLQTKGDLALINFSNKEGDSLLFYTISILKNNVVKISKKGDINYSLTFKQDSIFSTKANSLGFEIPIEIKTNKVKIIPLDFGYEIFLNYCLNVGGNISNESIELKVTSIN